MSAVAREHDLAMTLRVIKLFSSPAHHARSLSSAQVADEKWLCVSLVWADASAHPRALALAAWGVSGGGWGSEAHRPCWKLTAEHGAAGFQLLHPPCAQTGVAEVD